MVDGAFIEVYLSSEHYAKSAITAAVELGDGRTLLGTTGRGLVVKQGESLVPFTTEGLLSRPISINDLCRLEGGLFAASSNNIGIVFFDANGRVLQVLDRANDHRLARVRKLRSRRRRHPLGVAHQWYRPD
ncbi:MAG: hypothetical protein J6386_20615 [Candidatus Synoicihabitans palmerolidicus]|nr:hypothetical protein [Candidatus Synoicihabitans palmerolidicus]